MSVTGMKVIFIVLFVSVFIQVTFQQTSTTSANDDVVDYDPEEEPTTTFRMFERNLQYAAARLFTKSLSYARGGTTSMNISSECYGSIIQVVIGLTNLKEWAVTLLDASGKVSSGILEGTTSSLGDYDECINIEVNYKRRSAHYCMVEMKLSKVLKDALRDYQFGNKSYSDLASTDTFLGFLRHIKVDPEKVVSRIGLCVPSKCSVEDVQEILNNGLSGYDIPATVKRCEGRRKTKIEAHQIVILTLCAMFVAMVVIGTFSDMCLSSDTEAILGKSDFTENCMSFMRSFSIYQNTADLVNDEPCATSLPRCCRGIMFLAVVMTIYTHTYTLPHPAHPSRYRSAFNLLKFSEDISFGQIANPSVGIEIFFFLAGFMSMYRRWIGNDKEATGVFVLRFVLQAFLRMVLAQALVVCLFALLPLVGSGPLWQEFVEEPLENCKTGWWRNLLFVQNFQGPFHSCITHSWILATIMQIIIFTLIAMWILDRWPFYGTCLYVLMAVSAAVIVAVVTAVAEFPPTFAMYFYDYRTSLMMWKFFYVQGYNHIGSYCIGALAAIVSATQHKVKIKTPVVVVCWCASIATMLAIVYGLYDYRDGHPMNRALAVFYAATHRPAWAVALGWVAYACINGYGGIISQILSCETFMALERLSYLAYLIHLPLMYYQAGTQREMMFMGHFEQVMFFLSYTVFTFIISYLCYLVFQAPYMKFENLLFGSRNSIGSETISATGSAINLKKENIAALFSKKESSPALNVMDQ